MVRRILKTFAALGVGQCIHVLTQLVLPPAFIASYGMERYGEWLVLSAAVGYLSALDFGLQTYTTNELVMLFHRGDLLQFRRLQSVGWWLTLGLSLVGAVMASMVFVLPVERWLNVGWSHVAAAQALFWLALQLLAGIAMGNLSGLYRVVGQAHRGAMWGNVSRALSMAATVAMVVSHRELPEVASLQFLVLVVCIGIILLDLKRACPAVFPSLRYWDRTLALGVLKPSLFFGCFILNNFLIFQAPLLLLNRFLGPQIVVVFTVGRSLFSFVRQGAAMVQHSLAPEITRLYGVGDRLKLARVLAHAETLVLSASVVLGVGMLLVSPLALKLWLGRPELFDFWIYLLLMLVTTVMNVKDCQLYLQYFTNNHIAAGVVSTASYLGTLAVCWYLVPSFGPLGFIAAWLAVESIQLSWVHRFNTRLLAGAMVPGLGRLIRLSLLLTVITLGLVLFRPFLDPRAPIVQGFGAVLAMVAVGGGCYFLLDFGKLIGEWRTQSQKA
jgi:O-antigen/teichoic acid export membrane protein